MSGKAMTNSIVDAVTNAEQKAGHALRWRPIIETGICSMALITFALFFKNRWLPLWAATATPFLLLQSQRSVDLTHRIFRTVLRKSESFHTPSPEEEKKAHEALEIAKISYEAGIDRPGGGAAWYGLLFLLRTAFTLISIPFLLLLSVAIRYIATLYHLNSGLRAFPQNWRRCVFDESLYDKAWIVPGYIGTRDIFRAVGLGDDLGDASLLTSLGYLAGGTAYLAIFDLLSRIHYLQNSIFLALLGIISAIALMAIVMGCVGAAVNLFPVALRIVVKASSVVWSPLILNLDNPMKIGHDQKGLIDYYRSSVFARIASIYALFTLSASVGIGLFSFAKFEAVQSLGQSTVTLIHVWTCLGALNSLITIMLWYIVLPTMEYNLREHLQDNLPRVFVPAKLLQGLISMVMIPAGILSLAPKLYQWVLTWRLAF
jgi:hypothetical protein